MTGMKIDQEYVPDRHIEVQTDDEDNEAEINYDDDDDDDETESDSDLPPSALAQRNSSIITASDRSQNYAHDHWPQTYRQSMDMYTMPLHSMTSFRGTSELNLPIKRSFGPTHDDESSMRKPLISATSLEKDHVPVSTLPIKLSQISNLRISGLPPPVEQCSFSQSVLNAINVLCGIGILSMPYAFKEGGWLSLVLLMVFGVITCYTGILLKICLERSHGLQTYPDIGQAAFGYFGRICIAMVLYLDLFSSCVEYLIMMNDNLSSLFPHAHLEIGGIDLDSYLFCAIISTLVILPTVWLRNLSLLSYISAGGVVTLVAVVVCLLWLGVVDGVEYHPSRTALDSGNLPVAIGLIGFCYGSHSVFPNIYTSMKEPSRFPSVLLISFSVSFILYTTVGVYGYLLFGDSVKSQFTLNMPSHYITSKVATWTVVVAPVTKFALTITPIAYSIEELFPPTQQNSFAVSITIRTALTFFTLLVALKLPYFGVVMALTGSVLEMLVSIIFPCACYLRLLHGHTTTFEITICSLMIFAGLICAIIGTYSSLASIPTG